MAHVGTLTAHARAVVFCACLPLLSACGDSDGSSRDAESTTECPFQVDDLLAEVGESIPGREDCGSFGSASSEEIVEALDCLLSTDPPPPAPTELRVNRCIDCFIESTYIVTSQGAIFHVFREADHFGDEQREVAVERCADIVRDANQAVRCVDPEPLYDCQDLLPDAG